MNFEKVEVTTHLAEVAGERNEVKAIVSDLRRSEAAAREEVEQLASKLKEVSSHYCSVHKIELIFWQNINLPI